MEHPREAHDKIFVRFVEEISQRELDEESTLTAMKALTEFSKARPEAPEPEPIPPVVLTTKWDKFKHGAASVWDNETTRVTIKAAGAFAGVVAVIYSTVHKERVLERQAMNQANQRNS